MKMEVVLSGGNLGGEDANDGPYRNEDVREWSRVDRITGMLERARVETGRWRANTRDAAHSYGKMIDSRERNSADGSMVQKARRQVEIFQSQGVGGRSFQVVRASQWSSSRATDCVFDVPISKPNNTQLENEALSGDEPTLSPRLNLWRTSLNSRSSDLDRLSCLCRKLHNEAMNSTNMWSLRSTRSPSPLTSLDDTPRFQELEAGSPDPGDGLSIGSLGERRSNSSEDVSSLLNTDDAFARDSKLRRSLQIPSSSSDHGNSAVSDDDRVRRCRNEFIAERARRFEEGINGVKENTGTKKSYIGAKSFGSIADNDFVKNDPNHPSKLNQQFSKVSIQDNAEITQKQTSQTIHVRSGNNTGESRARANNLTVVHLRNVADDCLAGVNLEDKTTDDGTYGRSIDGTTTKEENASQQQTPSTTPTTTTTTPTTTTTTTTTTTSTTMINGAKPVKKVEFCKTEIHFAADSGKVNIVETDGKPPPTNKFRRRRRNNSLGAASNVNAQKSNMPLIHFGDTSYEKYIFGGQGKLPLGDVNKTAIINDNPTTIEEVKKNYKNLIEFEIKDRWNKPEKIREDSVITSNKELCRTIKDSALADNNLEKVADYNKHKGTHTTTVNFLSDENGSLTQINKDKPSSAFSTNHVIYKDASPKLSDKFANKNQIVTQDSENNQVLLKVVTTHKPVLAKVENDHTPSLSKTRSKCLGADAQEKNMTNDKVENNDKKIDSQDIENGNLEAKDHCDNSNGINDAVFNFNEAPTYENIFDAVTDGAPIYENFQAVKNTPIMTKDKKIPYGSPTVMKKKLSNSLSENIPSNASDRRHKKIVSKVNSNSNVDESNKINKLKNSDKGKNARSITPMSSVSSAKSEKNSIQSVYNQEIKCTNKINSRQSNSRDNSVKRYKVAKLIKDDDTKSIQTKRKISHEHKNTLSSSGAEKNDGTLRSKKPVEVVYQTAIFNMKNEKLSKPAKTKETKGPRLINEFICGSKIRRPSDSKKAIKTAIVSQNTSKRKELPTSMNR